MKLNRDDLLLFAKVCPDAVIPTKRDEDSGWDVYPCFEEDYIIIRPHETKMIKTGIASVFSQKYAAVLKERSSLGIKGITQHAGVIDSGYRNEWRVPLGNDSQQPLVIVKAYVDRKRLMETELKGTKPLFIDYHKAITQCLFVEVPEFEVNVIEYEQLVQYESSRGLGGFGSTDKK